MTKHALTRQLVDDIVRYLASGGSIVFDPDSQDIGRYLQARTLKTIKASERLSIYRQILRYMRQQNLIINSPMPQGRTRIRLGTAGIKRAQKITLADITIPKPNKWDQHWRVVFFDIPESKRQARNNLVAKLKELGFHQLQKSAWVHPFPCLIEIEFIKRSFELTPFVTLAEIDKIDRHSQLIRQFRSILA